MRGPWEEEDYHLCNPSEKLGGKPETQSELTNINHQNEANTPLIYPASYAKCSDDGQSASRFDGLKKPLVITISSERTASPK